jgi:iron(III) transport system substrate-binding protein
MKMKSVLIAAALGSLSVAALAQQKELNVICSVQAQWCNLIQTTFSRTSGITVNMTMKGSGEALAQIMAERANPKTDIWFGGTGDPHMLAAEQNLTLEYKSTQLSQLHGWAQRQAEQAGYKTVGVYLGPLGFGYNTELLTKKKISVPKTWNDLLKPEYKGEIQVADPRASGTAYTMIATLVQIMGEDKAFDYLAALHKNVSTYPRSGTGPIKAVARGEATVSISFIHDAPGEKAQGFPVETVTPTDGTGAEIGSMSIVKGARNLESAKAFYEWALTPSGQQFGATANQFQLPSNKGAATDPRMPDLKKIKLIDYDYAKFGQANVRKQLILNWERKVFNQPK